MSRSTIISADEAAALLRSGGVVAVPTETVYGLAAQCTDIRALNKIFEIKGRPADNPLILHVSQTINVDLWAEHNETSRVLADHFWPGPLTIVLPRKSTVPDEVTAGLDTVGIRMPDHPDMLKIISGVGKPLAAPSANLSGKPSPTRVEHVLADHPEGVSIVDGGPCRRGIESTVVRVNEGDITMLRPGTVTREEIEKVTGCAVNDARGSDGRQSPGTRHPHYAPNAIVRLFASSDELLRAVNSNGNQIICSMEKLDSPLEWAVLSRTSLYDTFRRADALRVDEILVLCDEAVTRDEALWNRLQKASEARNEDKPNV